MKRLDVTNMNYLRNYLSEHRKRASVVLIDTNIITGYLIKTQEMGQKRVLDELKNTSRAIAVPDFIYNEAHKVMIEMGYKIFFNDWVNAEDSLFLLVNTPYHYVTNQTPRMEGIIQRAPPQYHAVLDRYKSKADLSPCDLALICLGLNISEMQLTTVVLSEDLLMREAEPKIRITAKQSNTKIPLRIRKCGDFSV